MRWNESGGTGMAIDASTASVYIAAIAMVSAVATGLISLRSQRVLIAKQDTVVAKTEQTHKTMKEVEHNVNGRLSRQIEIAETSAADAAAMRKELAELKTLFAESLDHRPGATAEVRAALATPTPAAPELPPPFISQPAEPLKEPR